MSKVSGRAPAGQAGRAAHGALRSPPSGDHPSRLRELAERCEVATVAHRELDAAITVAINQGLRLPLENEIDNDEIRLGDVICTKGFTGSSAASPKITASLDEAVKLIPEKWAWLVEFVGVDPYPPCAADLWVPAQREDGSNFPRCRADAKTPALALCAAALKARAASADTLPKGQDAQQGLAGTEGGAVDAEGSETPNG